MQINELVQRFEMERKAAREALSDEARAAHEALAALYAERIERLKRTGEASPVRKRVGDRTENPLPGDQGVARKS